MEEVAGVLGVISEVVLDEPHTVMPKIDLEYLEDVRLGDLRELPGKSTVGYSRTGFGRVLETGTGNDDALRIRDATALGSVGNV
jgi:hypothetical protein